MSVTTQHDPDDPLVHSQYNLPTHQRRLRHLHSITARNLVCLHNRGVDIVNLQVFFTLHQDTKSKAFYTSEKITGSLNPTWQSFDLQRSDVDVDLLSKFVVVRVWIGNQNEFQLKIEWHVHLSGLVVFSDKLQVAGLKHGPDTLLMGMYNHIYCYLPPDVANPQLEQLVPDSSVASSDNLHAVLMDQSTLRPSYNTNYLSRIHTVLRAIKQTNASVRRIHSTIEDKLVSSKERSDKLTKREALLIRMRQLRQELFWQQQQKQKDEDELARLQGINDTLGKSVKAQRVSLTTFCSTSEEKRVSHIQYREMLVKENAQVFFRRRQLINEIIHHIYPIRKDDKEEFYICNVKLPNAEEYQGQDENMLAAALGFVCHLTLMVSQFMDTPLRYPMMHRGSRSVILDHVHSKLADKDREFPLFGKGKEKFQYNYGVFLLNKNISQMRFYCGLGTSDLRQTLSNLKSLLEQRLGLGPSSPSRGAFTPTAATQTTTPNHSSLENSLASQMSLHPSSSSSSFIPQNYFLLHHPHPQQQQQHHNQHHHHHHHHHHHSNSDNNNSARNLLTTSETGSRDRFDLSMLDIQNAAGRPSPHPPHHDINSSPLIFKNPRGGGDSTNNLHHHSGNGTTSSGGTPNGGGPTATTTTAAAAMSSSFSSWIESASKMTSAHKNNSSSNNLLSSSKDGGKDNNKENLDNDNNEDDENDDLFESSGDSFFSSVPKHRKPTTTTTNTNSDLFSNGSTTTTSNTTMTDTNGDPTSSGNHNDNGAATRTTLHTASSGGNGVLVQDGNNDDDGVAFITTNNHNTTTPIPNLLSPTPNRSFKLIKPQSKRNDDNDNDNKNDNKADNDDDDSFDVGEGGVLIHHDDEDDSGGKQNKNKSSSSAESSSTSLSPHNPATTTTRLHASSAAVPIPIPNSSGSSASQAQHHSHLERS